MGKKGGKKSSSATSAKAPKCTCDDPYKCACGNRPERPSRGHKWDPVAQQWGGKGHKQKGASGQTSSVGMAAKTTAVGKTQISEWQKLPSELIETYCRKEKRPYPKYKSLDQCRSGCYKYRIIIKDAKVTKRGGDHDMFFVPACEVPNEEQAREEAALLALLHLTPTIPHERVLPEPYKTTWLNALSNKKEDSKARKKSSSQKNDSSENIKSTNMDSLLLDKKPAAKHVAAASSNLLQGNNFTSLARKRQQIDAKKKERNARIRKHEAVRMANRDAQVFMSSQIRKQIESFLRGDVDETLLKALNESEDVKLEEDDEGDEDDLGKSYVIGRLSSEGFSKTQAKTSFIAIMKNPPSSLQKNPADEDGYLDKMYEECLQWLCVHLNEDQLPEGFDPRGRTLDVVMPTKLKKSAQSPNESKSSEPSQEAVDLSKTYGLTIEEASLLSTSSKNDTVDTLWESLAAAVGQDSGSYSNNKQVSSENFEVNTQIANDEIEVIQSMFVINEDFHMKTDGNHTEVKIEIPSLLDETETNKKILTIVYDKGSYPQIVPKVFVTGQWIEGSGTVFHVKLTEFLYSLPNDQPMIFEIFGYVQELLGEGEASLSEQRTDKILLPHLPGGSKLLASNKSKASNNKTTKISKSSMPKHRDYKIQRRPREKSFFWSKKPHETPPGTAFPKLSTLMESCRKRLPAAKARSKFLSVMEMAEKENNVVLVTGETGCGTCY